MLITMIHGSMRKSTTHMAAHQACKVFAGAEITEFFLPRDLPHFCAGCYVCYKTGENNCPHIEYTAPIWQAIVNADLLIFSTPVYVLHASGQMKALLDHFGWAFMIHRPVPQMFSKAALIITTAAGGGMKNSIKDIADSLKFWGVGAIYSYGAKVHASHISEIGKERQEDLFREVTQVAQKVRGRMSGGIKPSLKNKAVFAIGCHIQKRFAANTLDSAYWKKQGWLDGKRPWRD